MATTHSPRFLKLVENVLSHVREITRDELNAKFARGDAFHLLDVREDHEWAAGHLPRAAHLGKGIIERDVEVKFPDPATELVLYCGGGFRSALAADNLRKMGYTAVLSLAGGYRGWTDAGLKVEKSQ